MTNSKPPRLAGLAAILAPIGYSVDTWSPGDGQTRYRCFNHAGGDYFADHGSSSCVTTVLGYGAAQDMAYALRAACGPLLRDLDENGGSALDLSQPVRRTMASRHARLTQNEAEAAKRHGRPEAPALEKRAQRAAQALSEVLR